MLSSWQIASIHAQQGQSFGAQQSYSNQLSAMMPPPYQGLGATGFGGGFGGNGYNYGGSGMNGYGPGNSFGNSMTSFVGGMGHAMGGAAPFIGGFMGFRGGGIGGALGGFGMGSMIGAGINHVAGSFMEGAHEQASMERTLSQFQHMNAGSRTGRGFSRSDSMQIGNMVRQMERIPEMLTSFGELNRIMDKMGQMGLMQGVRDVGEFTRKFRDTVSALKDMAKVMGTTMEGALQSFSEARRSGFYNNGDIVRNALNRQITSSLTGMNQGQVGALQMFGAETGHAWGGSRRTGAQLALRTAGQLGMANRMGILSNDMIMEMTGKEGAEGIQSLAGDMSQLSYRMGTSNVGQALTLALGETRNGRYTGNMDQELVERVRSGELSLSELKQLARSKAGSRGAKLSFAAHKSRLRAEMIGAVGSEGIAMQLQEILGNRGWSNPDATNLVMQRFGASEEQANLLQQMMPNLQGIGSEMGLMNRGESRRAAVNSINREHGWDAIKHKIGKRLAHYTTDWAKDLGAGVRDYFQSWADDFLDDVSGSYRQFLTQRVGNEFKYSTASRGRLVGDSMSLMSRLGGTRMDVGSSGGLSGLAARAAHFLSGDRSAGEIALDTIKGSGLGGYIQSPGAATSIDDYFSGGASRLSRSGNIVLDSSIMGGASGIRSTDIDKIKRGISDLGGSRGADALSRVQSALGGGALSELESSFRNIMRGGQVSQEQDQSKRVQMILGKLRGNVSDSLWSADGWSRAQRLYKATEAAGGGEALIGALQQRAGGYRGSVDFGGLASGVMGLDPFNAPAVGKLVESTSKSLGGRFKGSDTEASWGEIKSLLDEGGNMSHVFESMVGKGGEGIREILSKKGALTQADKELLRSKGIDPDKLISKMSTSEGMKEIDRLMSAASKMSEKDMNTYLASSAASGLITYSDRMKERGNAAGERLSAKSGEEARARLMKSKAGVQALIALGAGAQGYKDAGVYQNPDGTKGFRDVNDNMSDMVSIYHGLDKRSRADMFRLGSDEFRRSVAFADDLRGRGKLGRARGQSTQDILDMAGMSDAPDEFRRKIEGEISKGKSKGLDREEIENVIKVLVEAQSKGLTSKAGGDQKTTMATEAEVANSLKGLSENNVKMAAILSGIASGKGVSDSLNELGNKK